MTFSFCLDAFHRFWQQNPALLYAIALLLGFSCALSWNPALLVPIAVLGMPFFFRRSHKKEGLCLRLFLACLLSICAFLFAASYYQLPTLPEEGMFGNAYIDISSISSNTTSYGKKWIYKGILQRFEPLAETSNGSVFPQHAPVTISLTQNPEISRPPANCAYCVNGILTETFPGYYALKVAQDTPWYPISGSWSFAEMRFCSKQIVNTYIQSHISGQQSAAFLAGIATGDFDDRLMALEFSRFGLQHIMAISGFHFGIIAAILSILLRGFFSKKLGTFFLIFLLSAYCFFLGSGPSILRAWITIGIALLGFLMEKRGSGLNSLGVAMLVVLLLDPLMFRNMGFQLSFIITAAILLFYPWLDVGMQQVFLKRPLGQAVEMDRLNQHGYCILAFFRQALALTSAVNFIAIPMMLFYSQQFPLLSLIYNLFFPFLVSIAMLLLLLALLLSVGIPFLGIGDALHSLNSSYTQWMLNFTYNIPVSWDVIWRAPTFSFELLLCYLTLAFCVGILLRHYLEQRQEALLDFAFI